MRTVIQEKINTKIAKEYLYKFSVSESSLYIIEISAQAKSWRQNLTRFGSFFKDDDLAIKINNQDFPKLNGKKGLFDGEVAWNGNNLKGFSKTDFFVTRLQKGEHTITFIPDQKPFLETIIVYQIGDQKEISIIPTIQQAAGEECRQWMTIVFIDIAIKTIDITAKATPGRSFLLFKRDDSDLKLIINGETQLNQESKSHKHWYWCGRTLQGSGKTFFKELNLSKGTHYIELWADRNPEIETVTCGLLLEKKEFNISDMLPYTRGGINKDEDYNRFDQEIVNKVNYWNNEFNNQEYRPPNLLDPNLLKAIIYIESRMGYYQTQEGYYPSYPDITQVGDPRNPAIHTLNNDGWIDPSTKKVAQEYEWKDGKIEILNYQGEAKIINFEDSIKWGIRWLYHKAQGITKDGTRYWRIWNEAVRNYNGNGNINYENAVYKVYRDGIDERDKNNPIKLWSTIFLAFIIITGALVFGVWLYSEQSKAWLTFEPGKEADLKYTLTANVLEGVIVKKKIVSKYYEGDKGYQGSYHAITPESDPYLYYKNILGDKEEEIIITGKNNNGTSIFYILKKTKNGFATVSNIDKFGSKNPAFRGNNFDFVDFDKDGTMEVRELFYQPVYANLWGKKRHIHRVWYSYNDEKEMYVAYKEDELDEGDPDEEPVFLW